MNKNKYDSAMSQREVAKALNIGRGLVSHIESAAMKKIKVALAERGIKVSDLFDTKAKKK